MATLFTLPVLLAGALAGPALGVPGPPAGSTAGSAALAYGLRQQDHAPSSQELRAELLKLRAPEAPRRVSALQNLARFGTHGKSAERAVAALLADPARRVRVEALRTLGAIGASAEVTVPALIRALETADPGEAVELSRGLARQGPAGRAGIEAALERGEVHAVAGFVAMGPAGAARLTELVGDTSLGPTAVLTLQRMGESGTVGLVAALVHPAVRRPALHALRRLGAGRPWRAEDPHPVPEAVDPLYAEAALWALAAGAPETLPAGNLCAQALREEPVLAEFGLWCLGLRGSEMLGSVEEHDDVQAILIEGLAHADPWVRATAAWALGRLNSVGEVWRPDMIPGAGSDLGALGGSKSLGSKPGRREGGGRGARRLQQWRQDALGWTDRTRPDPYVPEAADVPKELTAAVLELLGALDDEDPRVRRAALWSLAQSGARSSEAVTILTRGMTSLGGDPEEREAWSEAWLAGRPDPAKSLAVLEPWLGASDEVTRLVAVRALGRLANRPASEAAPLRGALRAALADSKPEVVEAALAGLATLEPEPADLPALAGAYERGVLGAAALLVRMGPAALEPLERFLEAQDPDLRGVAALAVARIGSVSAAGKTRLQALSRDEDRQVRLAAREALAALGRGAGGER